MILLTTVNPIDASGGIATVLYVLLSVMGLLGIGGLTGWWKGRKQAAVRDDKLDRVIDVVLDPDTGFDSHTRQLADITAKVSRNGGRSGSVGDTAGRVEDAVKGIRRDVRGVRSMLDQHIGQHDERDANIAARVGVLERHREQP